MTKLNDLVTTLASLDGRGLEPTGWIARHLRDAKLLPNNGRGRAPADLTTHDAATMLIGWTAADTAHKAATFAKLFSDMPWQVEKRVGGSKSSYKPRLPKPWREPRISVRRSPRSSRASAIL